MESEGLCRIFNTRLSKVNAQTQGGVLQGETYCQWKENDKLDFNMSQVINDKSIQKGMKWKPEIAYLILSSTNETYSHLRGKGRQPWHVWKCKSHLCLLMSGVRGLTLGSSLPYTCTGMPRHTHRHCDSAPLVPEGLPCRCPQGNSQTVSTCDCWCKSPSFPPQYPHSSDLGSWCMQS